MIGKEQLCSTIDERRDRLVDLSQSIHERPELGFEEHFAAGVLADELERNGFGIDARRSASIVLRSSRRRRARATPHHAGVRRLARHRSWLRPQHHRHAGVGRRRGSPTRWPKPWAVE